MTEPNFMNLRFERPSVAFAFDDADHVVGVVNRNEPEPTSSPVVAYVFDDALEDRVREVQKVLAHLRPNAPDWRVGKSVAKNLYEGDRDIGRMDHADDARFVVGARNVLRTVQGLLVRMHHAVTSANAAADHAKRQWEAAKEVAEKAAKTEAAYLAESPGLRDADRVELLTQIGLVEKRAEQYELLFQRAQVRLDAEQRAHAASVDNMRAAWERDKDGLKWSSRIGMDRRTVVFAYADGTFVLTRDRDAEPVDGSYARNGVGHVELTTDELRDLVLLANEHEVAAE